MELPQNVVPMPAERRVELKRLAEAATPGPWQVYCDGVVAGKPGEPSCRWVSGGNEEDPTWETQKYIAAVSPDVALATLAYVEALEKEVARLSQVEAARDAFALLADAELARETGPPGGFTLLTWCLRYGSDEDLDYIFDKLSRRCPAGKALVERAEKAEAANASLKEELADQEAEKLALVQENQSLHARLGPQPNQAEIDTVLAELQARLGRPAPLVAEAALAAAPTTTGEGKRNE